MIRNEVKLLLILYEKNNELVYILFYFFRLKWLKVMSILQ